MSGLDYTFTVEHIGERFKESELSITDNHTNETLTIQIIVNDKQLPLLNYQALPALLSDLIDLAVAVHLADRLGKKHGRMPRSLAEMPRHILLRLPVRTHERLNTPYVREKLRDILYWFTEDFWSFEFLPYERWGRSTQTQLILPFLSPSIPTAKTALWSGGLDAFAGAFQQLLADDTTHYTLFGTGSNGYMNKVQVKTAYALAELFPGRTNLVQLPFGLKDTSNEARKSSSMRSRGFVFLLLGAVCAYQEGQDTLYVHENGIGAINLPFRKSEVGVDHSRSVHPLSLRSMGELLSTIFEQKFSFKNPFLFWTKAQMCKELLTDHVAAQVFATVSCDRRHRASVMQCGYCSSCLLRRQAIAVHSDSDGTGYQITDSVSRKLKREDATHYRAMLAQVEDMKALLAAPDSWRKMARHYKTLMDIMENGDEPQERTQTQILHLYQRYVYEWEYIKERIGPEFLE